MDNMDLLSTFENNKQMLESYNQIYENFQLLIKAQTKHNITNMLSQQIAHINGILGPFIRSLEENDIELYSIVEPKLHEAMQAIKTINTR